MGAGGKVNKINEYRVFGSDKHNYTLLIAGLLAAQDWFENSLQKILATEGYNPATKSEATVLTYMTSGEFRPSRIAKKMRVSRQALSHIVKALVDAGIVVTSRDLEDKRSIILDFAPEAKGLRDAARQTLLSLEKLLELRIGAHAVDDLWRALDADWGDYVETKAELDELLNRRLRNNRKQLKRPGAVS